MISRNIPRRILNWHLAALAFFGMGTVLGIVFAAAGPVVGIRVLGGIAALSGIAGFAMVIYILRLEGPVAWIALSERAAGWREMATRRWDAVWLGRHSFDRYLQGAVWSGMN